MNLSLNSLLTDLQFSLQMGQLPLCLHAQEPLPLLVRMSSGWNAILMISSEAASMYNGSIKTNSNKHNLKQNRYLPWNPCRAVHLCNLQFYTSWSPGWLHLNSITCDQMCCTVWNACFYMTVDLRTVQWFESETTTAWLEQVVESHTTIFRWTFSSLTCISHKAYMCKWSFAVVEIRACKNTLRSVVRASSGTLMLTWHAELPEVTSLSRNLRTMQFVVNQSTCIKSAM